MSRSTHQSDRQSQKHIRWNRSALIFVDTDTQIFKAGTDKGMRQIKPVQGRDMPERAVVWAVLSAKGAEQIVKSGREKAQARAKVQDVRCGNGC